MKTKETIKKGKSMNKPFFIPLKAEYFDAFDRGDKVCEYRRAGSKFESIKPGRKVVLSKGYSGKRIDCVCTKVERVYISDLSEDLKAILRSIYQDNEIFLKIHLSDFGSPYVKEKIK